MRVRPQSTGIVHDLKQGLLKRAIAQISKREFLFKNMNIYALGQQTSIMQEVNSQQFMNVSPCPLPETVDFDSNPVDNMMSMCDVKLMPTQYSEDGFSQCRSKKKQEGNLRLESKNKERKLVIVDLDDQQKTSRPKLTKIHVQNEELVEDSREIDVYRTIKQREHEQRLRMMALEQKKKHAQPINLNNQRVMYSYDSKVIKLQKTKERQHQTISELKSSLIGTGQDDKIKKRYLQMKNSKSPTQVKNKINLTQKQIQEQRQKQGKYRRNHHKTLETATPSSLIKVNPQSQKQHEQALMVNQPGIKILIQQKEFSIEKVSQRANINRRMTRSQYLKIKSNEQVRQIFRNSNASLDKLKQNPQELSHKHKNIDQDTSKNGRQGKNKKYNLSPFRFHSKSQQKSKIMTYSLQGKAELLRNTKQKAFLFESKQEKKSLKKELNFVDKYNLLYLKFKGNPPRQSSQRLITELQSQSKILKSKASLHTVYSKKSSVVRQNRLIKKQM